MATRKMPIHLYWVTTPDHSEDWFILARTRRSAAKFHDSYEGYDDDYATAQLVVADTGAPESSFEGMPRHAQIPDLGELGFEIVDPRGGHRAVRLNGKLFIEGHLDALIAELTDNQLEATGKGRPNRTKRSTRPN
jgi:hypothetical protein